MREIVGLNTFPDGQLEIKLLVNNKKVNVIIQNNKLELENESGNFYYDFHTGRQLEVGELE